MRAFKPLKLQVGALRSLLLCLLMLFGVMPVVSAHAEETGLTFFRIGTGPTATTSYALGTAISAGISKPPGSRACDVGGLCGVPGLIAVAQTQESVLESLESIQSGELESALVPGDITYWLYHGTGPFQGRDKMDNLRVIANLMGVTMHIVVNANSGIETIGDLRGRRISVGPEGSSTQALARNILRVHGLKKDQLTQKELRPGPSADAMLSGDIDAFFLLGTSPDSVVADLKSKMNIKLLPLEGYALQQMHSLYPFISNVTIPAGDYGFENDVSSINLSVKWVTLVSQSHTLVEQITRAFWRSNVREIYLRNNPRAEFVEPTEAIKTGGIPLHNGARAFYEENGTALELSDADRARLAAALE